jgi:hypothetical protein
MREEKDVKKYECDLCKKDYRNQRELHEHMKLEHKAVLAEERELMKGAEAGIREPSTMTTKYICKVCGQRLEDDNLLNEHIAAAHHPKRTITVNDIVNFVFDGVLNYPKTKAEIVSAAERIKSNKPEVTPEIIDTLRNLPDKRFNDEAELAYGIQTSRLL